jgi:symplekin
MEEESRRRSTAPSASREARKRPTTVDIDRPDVKRLKVDSTEPSAPPPFLDHFDFTALPASLITDLIVVNLEAFSEPALIGLVQSFRQNQSAGSSHTTNATTSSHSGTEETVIQTSQAESAIPPASTETSKVKDEPIDPLQMDIDQDELDYEPERLNEEVGSFLPVFL